MTVEFQRRYPSAAMADRVVRALAADQPDHVHAERDGEMVRFRLAEGTPRSLRATVEDLLACLQVAERTG